MARECPLPLRPASLLRPPGLTGRAPRGPQGTDLSGAVFENAILTNATFGKDGAGRWANLKGSHFEGALLSQSDIRRVCANPTVDDDVRLEELGC